MTELQALDWTLRLLGFSLILQSLEFLQIRKEFSDEGYWPLPILKTDFDSFPSALRSPLLVLMRPRVFTSLIGCQLALAVFLMVQPHWLTALLILIISLLILWRFRGTYNGGSDSMTVLVLTASTFGLCFSESEWLVRASLFYIAAQVVLSYFLAGIVKIRSRTWWTGEALKAIVSKSVPSGWTARLQIPAFALTASWMILLFELLFPMALWTPATASVLILFGFLFHLGNIYFFGLNRFLWAWVAGYPALYFCSQF
jgi:hypothetical protein